MKILYSKHSVMLMTEICGNIYYAMYSNILFDNIKFREEFFVDQVDFDFCYKVKQKGYLILDSNQGGLEHQLGISHAYFNKPQWRQYLIIRNSTVLLYEQKIHFIQMRIKN